MKTIPNRLALLLAVIASLSACKDDNTEVTKQLDGRWELQSIDILETGQELFLDDQDLGFLYFDACEDRNENCKGYIESVDGVRSEFEFNVSGADKGYNPTTVTMSFYPTQDTVATKVQGVYDVVALSTVLTLERTDDGLIIKAKRPE